VAVEPDNVLKAVLDEVEVLLAPIIGAADGPRQRQLLFDAIGWDVDAITGLPVTAIDDALEPVPDLVEALTDGLDISDFPKILDALQSAGEAIGAVDEIEAAVRAGLPAIPAGALAVDLLNFLVTRYLRARFPRVYAMLALATLIDVPDAPLAAAPITDPANGRVVYDAIRRPAVRFDRLPKLVTNPAGLFAEVYWPPPGITDAASAYAAADRLFPRIADVIRSFGGDATYGVSSAAGLAYAPADPALVAHLLTFHQPLPPIDGPAGSTITSAIDLTTGIVGPQPPAKTGVVVLPSASVEIERMTSGWLVALALDGNAGGLLITKDGVSASAGSAALSADITVTKLANESGAAVLIGSRDGTHFAIGTIRMTAGGTFDAEGVDPRLGFDLLGMELVIKAGDGDSFLKSVLPPDGMRMPMDFGLSWSPSTGVVMRGGATLEIDLPIDLDLVFLRIPVISLSLGFKLPAGGAPEVALGVGATIELEIGPVYAAIEKMGLALVATFPDKGGNLGPADLGLRFLPPKGMALSVDAGPVSGGGYLMADYDKGEYAGILHLAIADTIEITAIGLLQTKMPDGSEGFSLVVLISAEFPAIQIGYGFYLKGVGGLVGINRSLNVPALQDGLRRGAVGSLLFPTDPIPRARQIIADVGAIFPPTKDQFVLGPMIKFGWGAEMVSVTLAVIIQVPALKIALLGRLQLMLPPVEEAAVILLRLDFAGIIDVPAKTISFDGSLDGSRIAVFSLTGDIAMRLNWGDRPDFAFSAGGLYPTYPSPPGFPALRRLGLQLASSDNPRLRMEVYFAVTPATLQFGGRAELYYGLDIAIVGKIEIDAGVSLDALITFPSTFVVDLDIHVLLRRNGQPFIGVELGLRVKGAQPIDIDGKATLHFLGEHSIPFHKTIGGDSQVTTLEPVPLAERVRAALGEERSWSAKAPPGATGVRVTEPPAAAGGPLRVHPLGSLSVRQTVAPLGVALEKAGEAAISGPRTLVITSLAIAGGTESALGLPAIKEHFAASQFFRMTERQRLEQPAFERMQAGVEARGGGLQCSGTCPVALEYEELEIPVEEDAPLPAFTLRVAEGAVLAWSVAGGVAASGPAAAAHRFDSEPLGFAARDDETWVVAAKSAPTVDGHLSAAESYATAAEAFAAAAGRDVVVAPLEEALA
jgi:hypothetical protein